MRRRHTWIVAILAVALGLAGCSARNLHPAKAVPVRLPSGTGITITTTTQPAIAGTAGTAALEVTPGTTVRAGTTIAISPSEPCDTAGAGAPEELYYDVSVSVLFSNNQTINQSYSADLIVEANKSSGQWSTEIAIPATTAPGPYSLTAMCFYGRTSLMPTYGSVPITVTAP
jgi:hypothetical protein